MPVWWELVGGDHHLKGCTHAHFLRRNWLFIGDAGTGDRAATFYTLIGNCHKEGINAEAYLTDIFQRPPSETNQTVHRLTPKAWAAEQARRKSVAQTAVVPT